MKKTYNPAYNPRKALQQECEAAGHIAATTGKQRADMDVVPGSNTSRPAPRGPVPHEAPPCFTAF